MRCRMRCPDCADRLVVEHGGVFVVCNERWLSISKGSPVVRGRDLASVLFFYTHEAKLGGIFYALIQLCKPDPQTTKSSRGVSNDVTHMCFSTDAAPLRSTLGTMPAAIGTLQLWMTLQLLVNARSAAVVHSRFTAPHQPLHSCDATNTETYKNVFLICLRDLVSEPSLEHQVRDMSSPCQCFILTSVPLGRTARRAECMAIRGLPNEMPIRA